MSDPSRAAEFLRQELAIAARLGVRRRVFAATSGLAAAHVGLNEEERGAQLFGAAAALREELDVGLYEKRQELLCEQAVAAAKAALGEDAFAAAWARGKAMTPEEIAAFTMPA